MCKKYGKPQNTPQVLMVNIHSFLFISGDIWDELWLWLRVYHMFQTHPVVD
jgi:hypothetical protein